MQYSANNNLKLFEGNDNVRREDYVDNFTIIDDGLSKFYVATLDSTNNYKITTGNSLSSLNDGYSIRVAIPSDSTGAVSVIVDSVTVPVKKPNGNAVTNFKANGVYNLTYYNSVFILTSGGGGDEVNFTSDKLLTGYTANNSDGEKVDGTMNNYSGIETQKNSVTKDIQKLETWSNTTGSGAFVYFHPNFNGYVDENTIIAQSIYGLSPSIIKYGELIGGNGSPSEGVLTGEFTGDANATASQILSDYSAYVKGSKVTGTMTNRGAVTSTLNAGGSYTIPAGYHNGSGKVSVNSLASQTSATATAAQILSGYTAWVNGSKLTGTASVSSLGGCEIIDYYLDPDETLSVTLPRLPKAAVYIWRSTSNGNINLDNSSHYANCAWWALKNSNFYYIGSGTSADYPFLSTTTNILKIYGAGSSRYQAVRVFL